MLLPPQGEDMFTLQINSTFTTVTLSAITEQARTLLHTLLRTIHAATCCYVLLHVDTLSATTAHACTLVGALSTVAHCDAL